MTDQAPRAAVLARYAERPVRADSDRGDLSADVIACSSELWQIGQELGRDLGRPVIDLPIDEFWIPDQAWASEPARQMSTAAPPSSILVFALRTEFTPEATRSWVASSLKHDVPLGFLLVDDLDDARFQAAKLRFAHTRIATEDDAVVDSVNGQCGPAGDLQAARPERLDTILTSPWRLLAIGGHSDLGHMGLGSHLLCGATGPEHVAGRRLADGCDPDHDSCRCTTKFLSTVVPTRSLPADVVALMGCATFDPAAGGSASSNSLCASTLSGQPVAVIAMLGDLDARFDAVGQCARSMAAGLSVGAAVRRLNQSHGVPTGFGIALVGDPAVRFAARTSTPGDDFDEGVVDCGDRAQPLLDRCFEAISRCRFADRLRRGLLKVSDKSMDPEVEDALDDLDAACLRVLDAAWAAVELLHEAVENQRWKDPELFLARLEGAIVHWDEAYLQTCPLIPGNDMYNALHAMLRLDEFGTGGRCLRCRSELSRSRYLDPSGTEPTRIATKCWQCGPFQDSAATTSEDAPLKAASEEAGPGGEPVLAIAVEGIHQPDGQIQPRLAVRAGADQLDRPGRLVVVLQDRLTEQTLSSVRAEGTLADLPQVKVSVPADVRSDQHVLWAAWVSDMTIAFTSTRTPVARFLG